MSEQIPSPRRCDLCRAYFISGTDAICVFRREVVKPEFSCSYFSARPQPSMPVMSTPTKKGIHHEKKF